MRPSTKEGSRPDVQISYSAAGYETMAAIAEELLAVAPQLSSDSADDAPEVSVVQSVPGRETLALIAESAQPARAEQTTLSYGDRISNAPGSRTPSRAPAPLHGVARSASQSSAPEISIGESAVGRETLAVITAELLPSTLDLLSPAALDAASVPLAATPLACAMRRQAPGADTANATPFAIFEMLTFVVQGPETASLSSDALRRRFVEEHLLQRLPAKNMAQVERVDVTPWTVRGTVVVRVWCKV